MCRRSRLRHPEFSLPMRDAPSCIVSVGVCRSCGGSWCARMVAVLSAPGAGKAASADGPTADGYTVAYGHGNAYSDHDADAHRHPDAHEYLDIHTYCDCYSDSYPDLDAHEYCDIYPHAYGYAHLHRHEHRDAYAHRNSYPHADLHAYCLADANPRLSGQSSWQWRHGGEPAVGWQWHDSRLLAAGYSCTSASGWGLLV